MDWNVLKNKIIESEKTTQDRRAICQNCEHRKEQTITTVEYCGKCGCIISAKTKIKNAKCPIGKW